jgi:hypothetical protein
VSFFSVASTKIVLRLSRGQHERRVLFRADCRSRSKIIERCPKIDFADSVSIGNFEDWLSKSVLNELAGA